MNTKYYLTTPIFYVNAEPHLGHIYTAILCDTMASYQKLKEKDVYFLTGVDEHGDKIVKAATKVNQMPSEYVNNISGKFKSTWITLKLNITDFIRTTEDRHKIVVQYVLKKLYDQGDIYLSDYEGIYCTGCERYLTEKELDGDGNCQDHKTKPDLIKEKNYFFKLQKYLPKWEEMLLKNKRIIQPDQYYKEVYGTIQELKKNGDDLSISRPVERLTWGIPLPFDDKFVTYVWFDALINYISAIGYPEGKTFQEYWPEATHVIAKDILKPHGVYWPAMLLAANIPVFKNLYVHGYWLGLNDAKMSKSLNNAFNPMDIIELVGMDSFRYFLMREMLFGNDCRFNSTIMANRINQDLANNIGNLIQRTLTMINKYSSGIIVQIEESGERKVINSTIHNVIEKYHDFMNTFQFSRALETIFIHIDKLNKLIEEKKPWEIAKKDISGVNNLLRVLLDGISISMAYLRPFLNDTYETYTSITGFVTNNKFPENIDEFTYNEKLKKEWSILFPRVNMTEDE